MILNALLSFIAGCIYMMRGNSQQLPNAKRWHTVIFQLVVITPFVWTNHLAPYIIPVYCAGWYLTICAGWGKNFTTHTTWEKIWFFGRMLFSFALFAPLALIKDFHWYSLFIAAQYTIPFAAITVSIYTLYNRIPGHTDKSFNWSEFATGALLAAMTFNLLGE